MRSIIQNTNQLQLRTHRPSGPPGFRTNSERLFADYLSANSVNFEYEVETPGKRKQPDFRLRCGAEAVISEVKELRQTRTRPAGATLFDPYRGIRKEIHEVRKQFKEFKEYPCLLVLYNVDDWEFQDWPYVLFGAMLGDAGVQYDVPIDSSRSSPVQLRSSFGDRGKMIDPKRMEPQNTTISAIAVLGEFPVPNPEFHNEVARRTTDLKKRLNRELTDTETGVIVWEVGMTTPVNTQRVHRLTLLENPLARVELFDWVCNGDFDAKYRINRYCGGIERVFAGIGLREAESITGDNIQISERIVRYAEEIRVRFAPAKIVLFGSHAYGCPDEHSDVDLLVVFSGDGEDSGRSLEIRKCLNADFPLDLITRSEGEVETRMAMDDWFMREVIERGRILYEA